jgi:dTDP-4-amino-4,6-dideoxygalactose transaminase
VFSERDRARILELVDGSLQSGALTLGPIAAELEQLFAARCSVGHAVATASGTSALEIVLRVLDVAGTDVIVPANTFFATAAAVHHAGANIRFADVAADTLALSQDAIEAAMTDDTSAVVLVHIGGLITPEIEKIADLCTRRGIHLVEDAAHAHGSTVDGRSAGSFGVAAAFSFYPTKVMTAAEGGMVVTDDDNLAAEARWYRDQGKAAFQGGEHVRLGYAWRMSELDAAVGLVQFDRLDEFIDVRRSVAARYDKALQGHPGITPLLEPDRCRSNYYKYIALLADASDRAAVKRHCRDEYGVALSGEVYARPLYREPVFADLARGTFDVAEDVCSRHICLPILSDMRDDEVDVTIEAVLAAVDWARKTRR